MARSRRFSADERAAIKKWLDDSYRLYTRPEYIKSDPVQFVHQYRDPTDQEVVGLIAASLAYGNVTSIHRSVNNVLQRLTETPAQFLMESDVNIIRRVLTGFRHRWTGENELGDLLVGMQHAIRESGGLGSLFMANDPGQGDVMKPLTAWVYSLLKGNNARGKPLLSDPAGGSACKRLHLYLRWMVRKDVIDAGCWPGIDPSRLIMPIDTHIFGFARTYGFTRRRAADGKAAREITDMFASVCPEDPVRYDFCLTRPGIIDGWRPDARPPWYSN